jgi:hypothetical protein
MNSFIVKMYDQGVSVREFRSYYQVASTMKPFLPDRKQALTEKQTDGKGN